MASEEAVEELQVDQPFDSTLQPEQSDAESLVGNCGAPSVAPTWPFFAPLSASLFSSYTETKKKFEMFLRDCEMAADSSSPLSAAVDF